jgi:hypothetical protein
MMKQESLDILVALGFSVDVFRFQPACHNKCIIVDIGCDVRLSQLVERGRRHEPRCQPDLQGRGNRRIPRARLPLHWNRLATAHPKARPRVAKKGEATAEGFSLVSDVFDD